jgi:hypothetical protein
MLLFTGIINQESPTKMSTSETKIELVTEAIEALVLAQHALLAPGLDRFSGPARHAELVDARHGLKDALKELLQPTLRVVQSQRRDVVGDNSTTLTRTVAEASNLA